MKSKKSYWIIVSLVALVSVLLIIGPNTSAQATTKRLKIGIIMPLSGPISMVGISLTRGVELYFDKINEEGGLQLGGNTYMLDLIPEDSKLDPTVAATATKKLVYKDGCRFIFGAIDSTVSQAIYQVCAKAKALHLITWMDAPGLPGDVSPKKPYAVRLCISSDAGWEMDYDYLRETYPEAKRLYIIAPDVGLSMERAKKLSKERGLILVGHDLWSIPTIDFLPYYTKALAARPDVIQAMCSGQAGYQLKTAWQLGFKGIFISDSPTEPEYILSIAGAEGSNDVITNGMDMNHLTPSMKECMEQWKKKFKDPFFTGPILTWVQAEVFVQALKKANSVDPKKVVAAFDSMTAAGSFETAFGPGHMGGGERLGVNRVLVRPMPITRLINGKVEFVDLKMPVVDK